MLWDVLDTLVYDPFYEHMPAFFDMSFQELMEAKHPTAWLEFEKGAIDEPQFAASFFSDGRAVDMAGLKAHMAAQYRWVHGMDSLVADLAVAHPEVDMHLLSNYPTWYELIEDKCVARVTFAPKRANAPASHTKHTATCRLALEQTHKLPWTFVSARTGYRKPDPAAYTSAVEALGCAASDVVFVDDRAANVDAAQAVGMRGVLFDGDANGARAALREYGLDV